VVILIPAENGAPKRACPARHPRRSSAKARTWVGFPFCWPGSHRPGTGPGGAGVARRCLLAAPAAKSGLLPPPLGRGLENRYITY
jgi:hypothetical protein